MSRPADLYMLKLRAERQIKLTELESTSSFFLEPELTHAQHYRSRKKEFIPILPFYPNDVKSIARVM